MHQWLKQNSLISVLALLCAISLGVYCFMIGKPKQKETLKQKETSKQKEPPVFFEPRIVDGDRTIVSYDLYVPREITDLGSSPIEFLDKLKLRKETGYSVPLSTNWITLNDVKKLAKQLDSKMPCTHVLSVFNQNGAPDHSSTEGVEAALMIRGYMAGIYPGNWDLDDLKEKNTILNDVRAWLNRHHIPTK